MVRWTNTHSVPALTVLGRDCINVANPIAIPLPDGCRVVNTDGINATHDQSARLPAQIRNAHVPLHLKSSPLEGANIVPQGGRGIGAAENELVQVDPPDEIFILPSLAQTRELHIHGAIVFK